jgi:hypothetical protein
MRSESRSSESTSGPCNRQADIPVGSQAGQWHEITIQLIPSGNAVKGECTENDLHTLFTRGGTLVTLPRSKFERRRAWPSPAADVRSAAKSAKLVAIAASDKREHHSDDLPRLRGRYVGQPFSSGTAFFKRAVPFFFVILSEVGSPASFVDEEPILVSPQRKNSLNGSPTVDLNSSTTRSTALTRTYDACLLLQPEVHRPRHRP